MSTDRIRSGGRAAVSRIAGDGLRWLGRHPRLLGVVGLALLLVILSPLYAIWLDLGPRLKWSQIVQSVVQSLAVVAGVFMIFRWLGERQDRATDVLLRLEDKFAEPRVLEGRALVEDRDWASPDRSDALDAMLRFYVILYGVLRARQIPEESLSICFRYWLAHYFRRDRPEFRKYVDLYYPTLSRWLREDAEAGCPFFRPGRLFADQVDPRFKDRCSEAGTP